MLLGILSCNEFSEILKELTFLNMGDNDLPDSWMSISESQVLVYMLVSEELYNVYNVVHTQHYVKRI